MRRGWLAISCGLLVACSGHDASSATPSSVPRAVAVDESVDAPPSADCGPATDGTIRVWTLAVTSATRDLLGEFAQAFEESTGMEVEVTRLGGDQEVVDRLAATPFDQWPDVVVVSERATRTLVDSGHFLPPQSCDPAFGDDLLPVVRSRYTVDGELQVVPFGVSTPVLIFDKVRFRAAGLDPDAPPATYAELLADSSTLVETNASPYGLVLTDWCAITVAEQNSARRGAVLAEPANGLTTPNITVDLTTPEISADLAGFREGVVDGHVKYIGPNYSGYDDLAQFMDATAGGAMSIHTSAAIGDIQRFLDGGNGPGIELGVGALPGPGAGSTVGGNALWIVNSGDPGRVGRAWALVTSMTSPANMADLAMTLGYAPASRSAAADPRLQQFWREHPEYRVAYDQLESMSASDASGGLTIGPFSGYLSAMYDACRHIMKGEAPIAVALADATNEINGAVAEYVELLGGTPVQATEVTPPVTNAPTLRELEGTAECTSGAAVVGVWVETESAVGSDWAVVALDGSSATFTAAIPDGDRYRLTVGCGGSEEAWASSSSTHFLDLGSVDLVCDDAPNVSDGECTVSSRP